ncbi:hypothetical protein JXJ21_10150 [candidate division KSB1 bacterium]|nr:hypothetical protein [candidate division KSB1 bacterium]
MNVSKYEKQKAASFERQLLVVILISCFIHTLFFLGYGAAYRNIQNAFTFLDLNNEEILPEETEKRIEFEFVETPEDAASDKPDNTNLLSDKDSEARDEYTENDKPEGEAFSEGDYDTRELTRSERADLTSLFQNMFVPQKPEADNEPNKDEQRENQTESDIYISKNLLQNYTKTRFTNEEFTRAALMGQSNALLAQKPSRQRLLHKQEEFSADNLGGFSFNTYAWNWAPYMQYMKEKINSNLFPPPAFYRMGLISGETLLKFKVMKNGDVVDIQVLKYSGHRSLMETSVNSLHGSDPLKPLPTDFPDSYEFLEVTARFEYIIGK